MNFKGGLLLDESVNLGDISTSSFGTPFPAKRAHDFDDSPVTQPRFAAKDEESEDEQDVIPPSPLYGKDEDVVPPDVPERDHTPTPKVDPEPQTPSRRSKIQITMETEGIVVGTQWTAVINVGSPCVQAKIWATIGDLIQPGYQYPGEGKTLHAKETMYVPPSRNFYHRH